ncbi:MAG: hypothetical protein ACP5JO_01315 [Candidatus Ratteibacteria bacterium]
MKSSNFFEIRIGFINLVNKIGWKQALQKYEKYFNISEDDAKTWWEWYENEICVPEVCYELDSGPQVIKGKKGRGKKVEKLPLIVTGQVDVEFMGNVYKLTNEGLYRFSVITKSVRNLIMIKNRHSVIPVLKALSLMQIHGNRDQSTTMKQRKKLLLSRYWISLACGDISALTKEVLSDAEITSRLVSVLTLEDWNTYNNGHVLIEVFFPDVSRWVLVDVDMGYIFMHNGELLSSYSFWKCLKENRCIMFVPLSQKEIDPLWLENDYYSYAHMWRVMERDLNSKLSWYKRIFQTFGFQSEGKFIYIGDGKDAKRIIEYRGHYSTTLPEREFIEKFYCERS